MSRRQPVRPSLRQGLLPSNPRGFALLITITLLAFLVLLLVSLASLTRVETQVASNGQQLAQARQNALFALNIALGQLQKAAGPDQRVTATAEILANTDVTKKKWTGVWDTRSTNLNDPPVWLVSQASTATADQPKNNTAAPVLAANVSSSTTAVRLVGGKSADISASPPANAGNEVVVPVQDIKSDNVPGVAAGATTVGRYGYWVSDEGVKARINLADPYITSTDTLSLLTRASSAQRTALELFSGPTSPTPATIDPATVITQSMVNASGRMLNAQQIKLLSAVDSSPPADAAAALSKITTGRFHDYTLWSAGVQADVKNGGLKWDLSTAFELGSSLALTDPANLFQLSEFGTNALIRRDPATNQVIAPVTSISTTKITGPRVSFLYLNPVAYTNGATTTNGLLRGPAWHLLRSHYLLYQERNPNTATSVLNTRSIYPNGKNSGLGDQGMPPSLYEANGSYSDKDPNLNNVIAAGAVNIPRITSGSMVPYISRMFVRFGVRTVPKNIAGHPEIQAVQMVMTPFVVLHNPYNVDLFFKSLSGKTNPADPASGRIAAQINLFASTGSGLPISTRIKINGFDYMQNGSPDNSAGPELVKLVANQTGGWPRFRLLVPEMTLKAGEVRLLYPQKLTPEVPMQSSPVDNTFITMNTTPQEDGGFIVSLLNGLRGTGPAGYKIKNNLGIPDINPPDTPANGTTGAPISDTAFAAQGNGASEIWCKDGDTIGVVMNANGGNMEIKYGMESFTGDDASSGGWGDWSLTYQLNAKAPDYVRTGTPTGAAAYTADYANYKQPNGTRADDYVRYNQPASYSNARTRYFFAMDFYAKSADQSADRATRPFITSNPVAFVQYNDAVGGKALTGSTNGTRGFPGVMPSYQLEFVNMDPASSNLYNYLYSDSGKANWGPTRESITTLDNSSAGLSSVALINVPSRPLTSLADFQHANIAIYGYQPYFAIGNSYASPYIPAGQSVNPVGFDGNATNPYFLFDLSYLTNEALWDSYFFSSLSQEFNGSSGAWNKTDTALAASIQSWANKTRTLPNARMVPYDSTRATAAANLTTLKTSYRQAAASLLTLGSFNVNSRSIDAWAAVLGAARNLEIVTSNGISLGSTTLNKATALPRMLPAKAESASNSPVLSDTTWNGFASLSDTQIRQLAKNIVAEITRRQGNKVVPGPFRSLGEFINRSLQNDLALNDQSNGAKGVLQAALDEPANSDSPNYRFFTGSTYRDVKDAQSTAKWPFVWKVNGTETDNSLAGRGPTTSTAQGFVLQANVLQQIGPYLSARSDTFVIRSYGEAVNPVTGESTGRAWCEAVVQRVPEYLDQTDPDLTKTTLGNLSTALYDATPPYSLSAFGVASSNLSTLNKTFGRRFKIVGFRWLTDQDI